MATLAFKWRGPIAGRANVFPPISSETAMQNMYTEISKSSLLILSMILWQIKKIIFSSLRKVNILFWQATSVILERSSHKHTPTVFCNQGIREDGRNCT